MTKRGTFITFEGCDGAGKTSVLKRVYNDLSTQGYRLLKTREPGGIEIAEKIRALILDPDHRAMDARTEALLYAAARRQHLVEKIIPALEEGYIVLCDRFIDSSLAYQGVARGIGMEEVYQLNQFAIGHYMPDITIYLDISPKEGLRRIHKNKEREVNRLDKETIHFHERVHAAYHQLVNKFPERIHTISAQQPLEEVVQQVIAYLTSRLS